MQDLIKKIEKNIKFLELRTVNSLIEAINNKYSNFLLYIYLIF